MPIKIRVTGILIEDQKILLVKQKVTDSRHWSLAGGTLEFGETIAECLIRGMAEETGLKVAIEKLLYICDRMGNDQNQVVHITFKLRRTGGSLQLGYEPEPDANPITELKMVPLDELGQYGFSQKFCDLVKGGFPDSGNYMGLIKNIGL